MITFSNKLYEETNEKLLQVQQTEKQVLKQAEKAYAIMHHALRELRDHMLDYSFESPEEEIRFFKEVKPRFLRELIYFSKVFHIESGCPVGGDNVLQEYYRRNLEGISVFFEQNRELYLYYRLGKTHLDDKLFRSGQETDLPYTEMYFWNAEPRFCCPCCYRIAKFQAYERLQDYLLAAASGDKRKKPSVIPDPDISWTAPKVWLIELIYALIAAGVFNKGNASIREVSSLIGGTFQKELGEYYRVFQEIRIRKKNRTVFMDMLKERLVGYMDDADQKIGR